MAEITKYFEEKKISSIEKAFLRQTSDQEEKNLAVNWTKEKNILEDALKVSETENREIKLKYDQLKRKHVKLLQVLQELNEKNFKLEAKLQTFCAQQKTNISIEADFSVSNATNPGHLDFVNSLLFYPIIIFQKQTKVHWPKLITYFRYH